MRSIVSPQFRKMLDRLPPRIQQDARTAFERWKKDPHSVGFKKLSGMHADVRSVEIGLHWRAIGVVSKEHNAIVWMFAGSHEAYNEYITGHRKMTEKAWFSANLQQRLEARRATVETTSPKPATCRP